jgi:TP53 regulating kinase-like protein
MHSIYRAGVNVPGVRMVDAAQGVLGVEWIEGESVRKLLPGGAEEEDETLDEANEGVEEEIDPLKEFGVSVGEDMHILSPLHLLMRFT